MKKIQKSKRSIANRINEEYVIGLNDYSQDSVFNGSQPGFNYLAAVEVSTEPQCPISSKMKYLSLPERKYVVFTYQARSQDSLQPVADYIYKTWFPQSNCQLNENAKYDFARYFEETDSEGKSRIEYWVPIC